MKINLIFNANLKSNDTQWKSILHIQNLKYQLQTSFFSLCEKWCIVGMWCFKYSTRMSAIFIITVQDTDIVLHVNNKYRITSVLMVKTDIITSIASESEGTSCDSGNNVCRDLEN